MNCGLCKKEMIVVGETMMCPDCNSDEIYEYNAFIRHDIKKVNEK